MCQSETHLVRQVKLVREVQSTLPLGRKSTLEISLLVKLHDISLHPPSTQSLHATHHFSLFKISQPQLIFCSRHICLCSCQIIFSRRQIPLDTINFQLNVESICSLLRAQFVFLTFERAEITVNGIEIPIALSHSISCCVQLVLQSRIDLTLPVNHHFQTARPNSPAPCPSTPASTFRPHPASPFSTPLFHSTSFSLLPSHQSTHHPSHPAACVLHPSTPSRGFHSVVWSSRTLRRLTLDPH